MIMKTTEQMNNEIQENFPYISLAEPYTGANVKTLIKCNNCGYTWRTYPRSVANSRCGCPKCGKAKVLHEKAKNLFLSRLDLNKWEFIDYESPSKVTVKCKTCNNIRITNSNNILRFGCKHCASMESNRDRILTNEEFIKRAQDVHNDTYTYDKVQYVNWNTPVIITCKNHGDFLQAPGKHLAGHGCPKCKGRNWTKEDFISASKEVHGNKYDYSKVIFNRKIDKVEIVCPKHGSFWQLPAVHIAMGCGCPICNESHGERLVANTLDSLNIKYKREYNVKNPYNDRNFRLDFTFKIKSKVFVIEYNGEQHYRQVERFGGKLQFEIQKQRDEDLRKLCKAKGIHLLEVKYDLSDYQVILSIKKFITAVLRSDL